MTLNRRNFLLLLGASVGAIALPNAANASELGNLLAQTDESEGPFSLPSLPYDYSALEPHIDARTMQFHHDKHHAGYVKNLNKAIGQYPQLQGKSVEDILRNINNIPKAIRPTIINNGGGHANHSMFWQIMSPDGGGEPTGAIAIAINNTFGSFDNFKEAFNAAGAKRFGSGWAWLVMDKKGEIKVMNTANQDSPFMDRLYPIMGNDVWEHAYYLNYQNRRSDYLTAWWNVVNWEEVNKRFVNAKV